MKIILRLICYLTSGKTSNLDILVISSSYKIITTKKYSYYNRSIANKHWDTQIKVNATKGFVPQFYFTPHIKNVYLLIKPVNKIIRPTPTKYIFRNCMLYIISHGPKRSQDIFNSLFLILLWLPKCETKNNFTKWLSS